MNNLFKHKEKSVFRISVKNCLKQYYFELIFFMVSLVE